MPEKIESGASMHLFRDPLGAGVDTFAAAVVVEHGEAGADGGSVELEPLVRLRRWGRPMERVMIHSVSLTSLPGAGFSRAAKSRMRSASVVISAQAAVIFSPAVSSSSGADSRGR